jgi:hypothetical protein
MPVTKRSNFRAATIGQISLSFDGAALAVSSRRFGCTVAAEGEWPSSVVVPPGPFLKLIKCVPPKAGLILAFHNGVLTLGGRTLECDARDANQKPRPKS